VKLLRQLQSDLEDRKIRIVWLDGSPGRGKSAIAKSLCVELLSNNISFFFNRNGADDDFTTTTKRFVSTIARQLARFSTEFRQGLVELDLERILSVHGNNDQGRLQDLIVQPAEMVKAWPTRIVVCIDALDECGDLYALEDLMKLIQMLLQLPPAFVIFISCRHLTPVHEFFENVPKAFRIRHSLDDGIDNIEDLQAYVRSSLTNIPRTTRSGSWPPELSRMDEFAAACGGLFEIASVRIRQVRDSRHLPQIEVFDDILKYPHDRTPSLEKEYRRIINSSYIYNLSEETAQSDPRAFERYQTAYRRYSLFTAILITVFDPLTLPELASLSQRGENEILTILQHLSPVMVVGDRRTPFRFYHASFPEFLRSSDGGTALKSFPICFDGPQHAAVLNYCFENFQQSEYARTMWIRHLQSSRAAEASLVSGVLKSFLQHGLIQWLEYTHGTDAHGQCQAYTRRDSILSTIPVDIFSAAITWCNKIVCALSHQVFTSSPLISLPART